MTEPTQTPYDPAFFSSIVDGSRASARRVVPVLLELLQPKSVVDIGCGTGAWLSVFKELGVSDIFGIDGNYVQRSALLIPKDRFQPHDLSQPLTLNRRFDMAMSLEVAEHLPQAVAPTFVRNLTTLSHQILFSAAIPLQGGNHHVNEQWPDYWKALFEHHGYVAVDCLRHRFWYDRDVERWYRQNLLLFVHSDALKASARLRAEYDACRHMPLSVVHPAVFMSPSLRTLLQMLPKTLFSAIRRRLKRD